MPGNLLALTSGLKICFGCGVSTGENCASRRCLAMSGDAVITWGRGVAVGTDWGCSLTLHNIADSHTHTPPTKNYWAQNINNKRLKTPETNVILYVNYWETQLWETLYINYWKYWSAYIVGSSITSILVYVFKLQMHLAVPGKP